MQTMGSQKIAVVTGSNRGIGFFIVKGLCEKFDGLVYLTARDVGRGEAAVQRLNQLGYKPIFHQLDITDQQSINTFKDHIKNTHGGLDLLINNAALFFAEQEEAPIKVNYFGTLRVCEALFPLLRKNAKVVNVSSSGGHLCAIQSEEAQAKLANPNMTIPELNKVMEELISLSMKNIHQRSGTFPYDVSKAGLAVLTFIQQRLFDEEHPNRNIAANAVVPGTAEIYGPQGQSIDDLNRERQARAPLFCALEANFKGKWVWKNTNVVDWYGPYPPLFTM